MDFKEISGILINFCRQRDLYYKEFYVTHDLNIEFVVNFENKYGDDIEITIKNPKDLNDVLIRLTEMFKIKENNNE